jgi:hypothetical protein
MFHPGEKIPKIAIVGDANPPGQHAIHPALSRLRHCWSLVQGDVNRDRVGIPEDRAQPNVAQDR